MFLSCTPAGNCCNFNSLQLPIGLAYQLLLLSLLVEKDFTFKKHQSRQAGTQVKPLWLRKDAERATRNEADNLRRQEKPRKPGVKTHLSVLYDRLD